MILDGLWAMVRSTAFWVAVGGTAFLTPLAGRIGSRLGAIDSPGAGKIHTHPIPRSGGLAVAAGILLAVIVSSVTGDGMRGSWSIELVGVLIGAGLLVTVGLWDDIRGISPFGKVLGQLAAAGCLLAVGIWPQTFPTPVAVLLVPLCVLGGTNAINLVDGLDGLAAGVAAIASVGFLVIGELAGLPMVSSVSLLLLGGCLGFLLHNFHPAKIFLGDSGSNLIGFLLAVLIIGVLGRSCDPRWFAAPFVILGLPIVDTAWSIFRRQSERRPVLKGDLGHLYNRLSARGLGHRGAVLACYAIGIACAACGLLIVGTITHGAS